MTDRSAPRPAPTPAPTTIRLAIGATLVWAVLNLVTQLSLWTTRSAFRQTLIDNNNKIGPNGKGYKNYADAGLLAKDVHGALVASTIRGIISLVIIAFIAYGIKNARVWSQWVAILVGLFGSFIGLAIGILGVTSFGDSLFPKPFDILTGITALASVAVMVLLFLNPSRRWYVENRPAPVTTAGAAPMGLRGLFMPRPRPGQGPGQAGTSTVVDVDPVADEPEHAASRGKAKVRATETTRPAARPGGNRRPTSKSRKV